MPNITIIIPTLSNTKGLEYLLKFLTQHHLPTIIVDNQPTPAKKKLCQHQLITYLPQTQNQGFAIAVNLAVKQVKTPWTLILNDDIEFLEPDALEQLIKVAQKRHYAVVSPVLQKPSGQVENLGYTLLPQGQVKLNYDPQLQDLDGITAACLLIKTQVFKEIGSFDERFFAYLEDVDLFLRLKRDGFTFGIATDIKVVHNHMTTSSKMGNFKAKMDLRNWCYLIIKNWDRQIIFYHFGPIFLERLRNLWGYLKATVQAYSWQAIYKVPLELGQICYEVIKFVITQY